MLAEQFERANSGCGLERVFPGWRALAVDNGLGLHAPIDDLHKALLDPHLVDGNLRDNLAADGNGIAARRYVE